MQGLTLPAWVVLSLYWLVTILIDLILTDPNPPSTPRKPPSTTDTKAITKAPPPREPLLVHLATNHTFLYLWRTYILTLPAVHLTLLNYLHAVPGHPPLPPQSSSSSSSSFSFSSSVLRLDLLCPYYPPNSPTFLRTIPPSTLLGILLVLLSSPLRLLCFYQLGPSFTFRLTPPKTGLVKSGLYKYVRHPSYTTAILCMAGYVLTFAAPGGVAMRCFFGEEDGILGWGMGKVLVVAVSCMLVLGLVEMF
ncbi:hypothetical protein L211DRAFT_835969, partial [Terfezia boudieri ATCC MYA-4762]